MGGYLGHKREPARWDKKGTARGDKGKPGKKGKNGKKRKRLQKARKKLNGKKEKNPIKKTDTKKRTKEKNARGKKRKTSAKRNNGDIKKKTKTNSKKRKPNTEKKKRKKEKRRQRGKKKRGRKSKKKRKHRGKPIDGRNTKTCSDSTTVRSGGLEDAVDVLKYLRSQVRTFNRKFARIKSFNKTVGNKLGKKGVFEETAKYLLLALGGNISSAACGETGSRRTKSWDKNTAVATYNTLNNCSAAIKEACTMPTTTLSDEDVSTFTTCTDSFKTALAADDCRTNSK